MWSKNPLKAKFFILVDLFNPLVFDPVSISLCHDIFYKLESVSLMSGFSGCLLSTMIFPFPFLRPRTRIFLFFSQIPRREISSQKLVLEI